MSRAFLACRAQPRAIGPYWIDRPGLVEEDVVDTDDGPRSVGEADEDRSRAGAVGLSIEGVQVDTVGASTATRSLIVVWFTGASWLLVLLTPSSSGMPELR